MNGYTLYTLNARAMELAKLGEDAGNTLQAPSKGLGAGWRQAGYKAPNTRALVLKALHAHYPSGFTLAQAQACIKAGVLAGAVNLGSGTPNSYCKAFVANGYFAEVETAEEYAKLEEAPAEPVAKPKRKATK